MIQVSEAGDKNRVIDAIVLGFSTDPFMRWLFPEARQFLSVFPNLMQLFGGRAFDHKAAYHADGYSGGALWLPPGIHPDEDAIVSLFQQHLSGSVLDDVFGVFEQMDATHPEEPCWHLAFVAVDPAHQNKGIGAALLKHSLAACDKEGKLAYLESTNPANISLYQRHGFELSSEMQSGSSPPLFAMRREPR